MKNNNYNREIHAYQNDDGTYKVEILEDKLITKIEKADIYIYIYILLYMQRKMEIE